MIDLIFLLIEAAIVGFAFGLTSKATNALKQSQEHIDLLQTILTDVAHGRATSHIEEDGTITFTRST